MSSIFPVESKKLSPSSFMAALPSAAGDASLASPVFSAVAPSDPEIPASPKTSVTTARSLNDQPTESSIGPAVDMASNRSCTVVFACACAFASILVASFAFNSWSEKIFRAFPTPPVTIDRSVAVPAARSIAGAIISAASAALNPCLA